MQFVRSTEYVSIVACHLTIMRRSKRRWYCRVRVLERAERLGLISKLELQVRLTALTEWFMNRTFQRLARGRASVRVGFTLIELLVTRQVHPTCLFL